MWSCAGNLGTMRPCEWGSVVTGMEGVGQGCCVIHIGIPRMPATVLSGKLVPNKHWLFPGWISLEWYWKVKSSLQIKLIIIMPLGKAIKKSGKNSWYKMRLKLDWGKIMGRILLRPGRSSWLVYLPICPLQMRSGKQFQISAQQLLNN